MKKQELIQLNALLYEVADYLNESFESSSVDTGELVDQKPGLASPTDIHLSKERYKDTSVWLSNYIANELEGEPHDIEEPEPYFDGEELQVYLESGNFRFYDGGEDIFSCDENKEHSRRGDVLEELVEGRSVDDVKKELYEFTESASKMRYDFQPLVDSEGYLKDRYESDLSRFVDECIKQTPTAD